MSAEIEGGFFTVYCLYCSWEKSGITSETRAEEIAADHDDKCPEECEKFQGALDSLVEKVRR